MPKVVRPIFLFNRFATDPKDVGIRVDSLKQSHREFSSRWQLFQLCRKHWADDTNKKRIRRTRLILKLACLCAHSFKAALVEN